MFFFIQYSFIVPAVKKEDAFGIHFKRMIQKITLNGEPCSDSGTFCEALLSNWVEVKLCGT
jgi:hypothetical protein